MALHSCHSCHGSRVYWGMWCDFPHGEAFILLQYSSVSNCAVMSVMHNYPNIHFCLVSPRIFVHWSSWVWFSPPWMVIHACLCRCTCVCVVRVCALVCVVRVCALVCVVRVCALVCVVLCVHLYVWYVCVCGTYVCTCMCVMCVCVCTCNSVCQCM